MADFRRGFKTEANDYALEFRSELKLQPSAPLSPFDLAKHLAVPVVALSAHTDRTPEAVAHFRNQGLSKFSAMVVHSGTYKCIVFNDFHHIHRQFSSVAHELAHIILGHPPAPPLDREGRRNSDSANEQEASWLGFNLLISNQAALSIVRRGLTENQAAQEYRVSPQAVRFRVNASGAKKIVQRQRRFRAKRRAYW